MILEYISVIIAFIWIVAATISDIKTKEVPDWLSFSLIIIASFINILYSLFFNIYTNLIYSLISFIVYFLFGNFMYLLKQWGGGDTKLLIGLGILIPIYPSFLLKYFNPNLNLPFLAILLINILVFGGIYGILLSVYYAFKNKKPFKKQFIMLINKNKKILILPFIILIFPLLSLLLFKNLFLILLMLSLLVIILPFLFIFIKAVELVSMYKKIKIDSLREGDWVINDIKSKGKLIYKSKFSGITNKEISLLRIKGIKEVLIKEGFPFVPSFLIGFVLTLIFGNFIFLF